METKRFKVGHSASLSDYDEVRRTPTLRRLEAIQNHEMRLQPAEVKAEEDSKEVSNCEMSSLSRLPVVLFPTDADNNKNHPNHSPKGNSDNDSQRGNETKPVDEPSSPSNKVGTIEMRRLGTSSLPDNSSSSVSAADQSVLIIWEKDVDTKPVNENVKKSHLLDFLASSESAYLSDLLIEYVAAGDGGAQSVLNLRKVCSATKRWVDSLNPTLGRRIYRRLPVQFKLSRINLEMFHKYPPPPLASSMVLQLTFPQKPKPYLKIPENVKRRYPTFFSFWAGQMQTLRVDKFTSVLVDVLGFPRSLRNLNCDQIESTIDPNLLQLLESISFNNSFTDNPRWHELELSFFRRLGDSPNLKRLAIQITWGYRYHNNENPFEGLQNVIDNKRGVANFQVRVDLRGDYWYLRHATRRHHLENQLASFLYSVAASASCIRMFPVETVLLGHCDPSALTTLLKSVESLELLDEEDFLGFFSAQRQVPNMKTLRLDIYRMGAEQWNLLQYPIGLQNLYIKTIFNQEVFSTRQRFPASLTLLNLELKESYDNPCPIPWSPQKWIEFLTFISECCPLLKELVISASIPIKTLSSWKPSSNIPHHSFQNLKVLTFKNRDYYMPIRPVYDYAFDPPYSTRCFLFHILQVQRMPSLLKLTMIGSKGKRDLRVVVDSFCIASLANSPLAKSLVCLDLKECNIREEAKESYEEIQVIVRENKRKHQEQFGSEGI